jgi:membrane protein implicated in regulation of membrane protease activity
MTWWAWCIVGTLLLGAELFAVDAQFYLVFIGIGAVIVGLLGLIGIDMPQWVQWLVFAVLSIIAMFTIRRELYDKLHRRPLGKVDSDVDHCVVVTQDLAPGKSCRVEYRGSGWTAVNIGDRVIPAGSDARIDAVDGLTLRVRLVG